jgi:3-oxoadipate enol-lactonase
VAGISYGGEVAQAFALRHPDRVLSLVLADTVSEVGAELRIVMQTWLAAARGGDADAFFDVTVPWNFSPAFVAANGPLLAEARRRYRELDLAAVARVCEAFGGVGFTDRLAEIAVPTCVIVAADDILKGPAYARIIADRIAGAELHVIARAGHAVCWERPAEFNTVVLGFLAKRA